MRRIGAFPESYPDEIFYSLCARYRHDRVAYRSDWPFYMELFGFRVSISARFPLHLARIVEALPANYELTTNEIISKHTIFPLYAPFLEREKCLRYQEIMAGRNMDEHGSKKVLTPWVSSLHQYLTYCVQCVHEDRKSFGETYWHRIHQCPTVFVCPFHETPLQSSNVSIKERLIYQPIVTAESVIPRTPSQSEQTSLYIPFKIALELSQDSLWLLSNSVDSDREAILARYRILMEEREFGDYFGNLDYKAAIKQFKDRYSEEVLQALNCSLEDGDNRSWIARLLRKSSISSGVVNPIRQLLFIRSFGIAAQEFFQRSSEYTPFGSKSWRCRNPFCLHYNNHSIEIVTIGRNWRAKPVGLFECECGFSYTIVGPYLEDVDEQRPWLVQDYGPIWEEGVHSLWNEAQSSGRSPIIALAEKLEVPYEVARYHAARLGLYSRGGMRNADQEQSSRRSKATEKTQESRQLIVALLKDNPSFQRKSLDDEGLKAYEWLRVHDSEWFNENWPKQVVTKSHSTTFLDWSQLDAEHVDTIKQAALKIKQEAPPVQITKSELMRRGVSVRIKHSRDLGKMPHTMALLEDVLESPTQIAIRRIAYLSDLYKTERVVPTRAAFLTRGSLYPYVGAVEVDEAVNLALLEITASQNG